MTDQTVRADVPVEVGPAARAASPRDIQEASDAARDYIQGFTLGDAERHARAYHPECIKRRFVTAEASGIDELHVLSPQIMADYAERVGTTYHDCESSIVIDAISEGMASVRVYSCQWVDFLHVVRARGAWRLLHVTWHDRPSA